MYDILDLVLILKQHLRLTLAVLRKLLDLLQCDAELLLGRQEALVVLVEIWQDNLVHL